jgi:hypothetical protein
MKRMADPLPDEGNDVFIHQPVIDFLAIPADFHHFHLAQDAEMMRNGGFTHLKFFSDGIDIQFLVDDCGNDPNTAGITERPEQFSYICSQMFVQWNGRGLVNWHNINI